MSFMFRNDQWDDNWDQYKVDLEVENERLRKENEKLKISLIRNQGYNVQEAKKALEKFDGNVEKALHYLLIRGDAVCRRKRNGTLWTEQDYIDYINQIDF